MAEAASTTMHSETTRGGGVTIDNASAPDFGGSDPTCLHRDVASSTSPLYYAETIGNVKPVERSLLLTRERDDVNDVDDADDADDHAVKNALAVIRHIIAGKAYAPDRGRICSDQEGFLGNNGKSDINDQAREHASTGTDDSD